jgi:hypothetical protein
MNEDLSCRGRARLIIEEQGGKIIWVDREIPGEENVGHAFVVKNGQLSTELALNQPGRGYAKMTVKEAERIGKDVTHEILSSNWSVL